MEVQVTHIGAPDYRGLNCRLTVPSRYEVEHWLGSGTGGIVCKAHDREEDRDVALKCVQGHVTLARGALKVLRELRVMQHLSQCEPIVKLYGAFRCGAWHGTDTSVCLVMELMQTDLENVIRSGQIDEENAPYFTYQLVLGLKYMHQCGIIHRDLKPSNLLVNDDCTLKIADFGSARDAVNPETEYVVTRWYRAPELLMSLKYNEKVDLFAVGCILGQMLRSIVLGPNPPPSADRASPDPTVLFPGRHYIEQMKLILKLVGFPSEEELAAVDSPAAKKYLLEMKSSLGAGQPCFGETFTGIPPDALELLQWMLQFTAQKRCTADEALNHRWLVDYHDGADPPVQPFDNSFEQLNDLQTILGLLDREMVIYTAAPLPPSSCPPVQEMIAAAPTATAAGGGSAVAPGCHTVTVTPSIKPTTPLENLSMSRPPQMSPDSHPTRNKTGEVCR
eukprot:GGOE01021589.1.p1 GENE.GGOE01021589.1~~GGOE01021589.1.p1  ORF type:complete len:448 (+),score=128.47 GGOE01021589.1:89-1432(+)